MPRRDRVVEAFRPGFRYHPDMNDAELVALLLEHKWLPALALVIGLVIRLLKSDVRGPTIPKKYRAPLAFGLGLSLGVLQRKVSGASWLDAILTGLITGCLPILGHSVFVEKLRKGLELPIPGLMVKKPDATKNSAADTHDGDRS